VESYEAKFDELSKKIDKMEASIDELVAMANRSRGALWLGLGLVSTISSIVGFIAHWFSNK
jgi:phage-related minor tail protein